ncbi:DUF5130 family protein [Nocardioides sp. YIM 152588]|uniref:DUF5130 family protein n=1 Tax=Nocardioides sp. YIM 152588 TaxID=3158259 RepID=UPI0032E3CD7D
MPYLTPAEQATLDVAIRAAEQACRAEISVYVGTVEGDQRAFATSLHNTLVLPARSILIMVDPGRRIVEIVTGGHVRRTLTDDDVTEAVEQMSASFADGDLAGGLVHGVQLLAERTAA